MTTVLDELKSLVGEPWSTRSFAARAAISDLRRSQTQMDDLETLEIGESLGPWRIVRSGEDFDWRLTNRPSINDHGAWELSRPFIPGDKGEHIRVVLIGESAAGSFGFWESSTLARQLASRLARVDERFDVIDLSCVNASMELCLEVMKHAITLDPDYIILFCANNEGKSLLENFDLGALNAQVPSSVRWSFTGAADLDRFGPAMISALAEHSVNQLARAKRIADHFDVGLLYVLPESNAVDWAPQEQQPFHLTGKDALRWHATGRPCSQAGSGYLSQWSAWEAGRSLEATDPAAALTCYDVAREIGIGAFVNAIPQTVLTVAESLRSHCRSAAITHVDMPALLRSKDGSKRPDRRYFIDYCHLSAAGIDELAIACARQIGDMHGVEVSRAVSDADASARMPSRERFLGALVGAIHNYHYGQPDEIVAHWLREALDAGWPFGRDFLVLIRSFLLERARETITPARLDTHAAFRELTDRYKLFFLKFVYHGRFDRQLVQIMDVVLGDDALPALLARRKDDLKTFSGDLYSLFYMDCHKGIRPRLRGSNRTGWERPDLEFVIDRPHFEVDVPPTAWCYDALAITLEVEDPRDGTLACEFDGVPVGRLPLVDGRACYRFALGRQGGDPRGPLHLLRFSIDHMVGLADRQGPAERYRHLGRFGWYPCGGRVVGLKLRGTGEAAP